MRLYEYRIVIRGNDNETRIEEGTIRNELGELIPVVFQKFAAARVAEGDCGGPWTVDHISFRRLDD